MRFIEQRLDQLKFGFERLSNVPIEAVSDPAEVESGGTRYLNASSADLLGISTDPRFREAFVSSQRRYGASLASREHALRLQLEARLAERFNVEAVVLLRRSALNEIVSDLGRMRPIADRYCTLLPDAESVASIDSLEDRIEREPSLVVFDALHELSGDLSPINRISEVVRRHQSALAVFDRTFGILGANGLGATEHLGCAALTDMVIHDLSHISAVPVLAIAGSQAMCAHLARSESTAPTLIAVATLSRAIDVIEAEPHRRERVYSLAEQLLLELNRNGFDTGPAVTPWLPVWMAEPSLAHQWLRTLAEHRVFARAALKRGQSRLLLSVSAGMTEAQLTQLLSAIEKTKRKHGLPSSTPSSERPALSRPGTFITTRSAAAHWVDQSGVVNAPGDRLGYLRERVVDVLDTVTWRASNFRPSTMRAAVDVEAIRSFFNRRRR